MGYFKVLKKNGGFTMAEVMVTVGILGILAFAIINQSDLAFKSKRNTNEEAVINYLVDRVAVELSRQSTCSDPKNFQGKPITNRGNLLPTWPPITAIYGIDVSSASALPIVQVGQTYGKKDIANGWSAPTSPMTDIVKVTSIKSQMNPTNANQMDVYITFTKMNTLSGTFLATDRTVVIPLTIIPNPADTTKVLHCFNDVTNSIASAIRLSCQGVTDYYDSTPTAGNPWGTCKHDADTTVDCGANKGMSVINYDATTHKITYGCQSLQPSNGACPNGQVITSVNADGSTTCGYPFKPCNAGQIMIKQSNGSYTCLNTDTGCSGMFAIQQFTAGGVVCQPFYPTQTCAGFVQSIGPGTVSCSAYIKPKSCPAGQFVSSFDSFGNAVCTNYIKTSQSCPGGQGAIGVDASGNLICQTLARRVLCSGSYNNHTYANCTGAGGSVYNYGSTNAYCHFGGSACPGGWAQCPTYAATNTVSCTDSDSNCSYSTHTTKTAWAQAFNSPVTPQTVQCGYWARNSGPWVRSCTYYSTSGPAATQTTTEIGCY